MYLYAYMGTLYNISQDFESAIMYFKKALVIKAYNKLEATMANNNNRPSYQTKLCIITIPFSFHRNKPLLKHLMFSKLNN
mmetsp:Transcript_3011/g.3152  ORF Transcript_3011/g.3152 Transcript_3011/m.3152 type:complete len:80 (+) Transcript_3011:135-374(+)